MNGLALLTMFAVRSPNLLIGLICAGALLYVIVTYPKHHRKIMAEINAQCAEHFDEESGCWEPSLSRDEISGSFVARCTEYDQIGESKSSFEDAKAALNRKVLFIRKWRRGEIEEEG